MKGFLNVLASVPLFASALLNEVMNLANVLHDVTSRVDKSFVRIMKKTRFKVGDMISSDCGDHGVVLNVGPRPDYDDIDKMGVYVVWAKEKLSFWMHIDEPTIQLYAEARKEVKT